MAPDLDTLLWAGGAATTLRWQFTRRTRGPVAEQAVPEPPPAQAPGLTGLWDSRVGAKDRVLPGSRLTGVCPIRNGTEAVIELVPGKQTAGNAMAVTDMVCSALQLPVGSVIVEPTAGGRADLARLLVIDDNPLHREHRWSTPTLSLATGCADAGVFGDEQAARVRWFTPGSGATNLLVAGAPGSGKSRLLDWLLVESTRAQRIDPATGAAVPWVQTWLGDGQQGQSLPDWLDLVDWPATTTAEILRMFRAAKRVMDARSRKLARWRWTDDKGRARRGLKAWDPEITGLPLLQIVLDECHAPLAESPELVVLAKEIARKGRKCGIRLVFATQVPSVQNLGSDIDLRSLLSGNVVCFRTQDRISGGMAFAGASADMDPSALPKEFPNGEPTGGLGYVLGPGARPAPMRGLHVVDPYDEAVGWPLATMADFEVAAAGRDYATRWERIHAELDDDSEPLEEVAAGLARISDGTDTATADRSDGTDEADTADTARELVLEVVTELAGEHGTTTRAAVIEAVGGRLALRTVGDALTQLTDTGQLERVSRGVYALPGEGEAAA